MTWIQRIVLSVAAIAVGVFLGVGGLAVWQGRDGSTGAVIPYFGPSPTPTPLPYLKHAFSYLKSEYVPQTSQILLDDVISQEEEYTAYRFVYTTDNKRMTGQLNLPKEATDSSATKFPVILMIRGFVPLEIYQTGVGTRNAADRFASNGYITIAPDFLGYGGSDSPDPDSLGARLEKPRHILDLIASLPQLSFVDMYRMGIWAHSNGGQIALSMLEITGDAYPTTLWAPVSKSFPYSILYYADESEDQGKALRKVVAEFEEEYDVYDFSIDRYWDWITAPVQVHQGTGDDAIPVEWTNALVENLEDQELEVRYFTYPAADHDMRPVWETVVAHDLDFFGEFLSASRSAETEVQIEEAL